MARTVSRSAVEQALSDAGLSEDDLREDYSGRGMFGDTCFGVVCSIGELLRFAAAYAEAITQDGSGEWDWIGDARSDGMGLSTIWYWPGYQLGDE